MEGFVCLKNTVSCNLQGVKGTDVQPILTENSRNVSGVFIPRINEFFYSEGFLNP